MKFLKNLYIWDKKQFKKPEALLGISIALGVLFGYGADNVGLGIVLGVAVGAGLAANRKKAIKTEKSVQEQEENKLNQ